MFSGCRRDKFFPFTRPLIALVCNLVQAGEDIRHDGIDGLLAVGFGAVLCCCNGCAGRHHDHQLCLGLCQFVVLRHVFNQEARGLLIVSCLAFFDDVRDFRLTLQDRQLIAGRMMIKITGHEYTHNVMSKS